MHHRFPSLVFTAALIGCGPGSEPGTKDKTTDPTTTDWTASWSCTLTGQTEPEYAAQIGCYDDFLTVASAPLDASIPGAQSVKTVVDHFDGDPLYFMNSQKYLIHEMFVDANLVPPFHPIPKPEPFIDQYTNPGRRFILGAVTYYEEPDVWAYEIAPYDTADAPMISLAYDLISENAYFGRKLYYHPTSAAQDSQIGDLPPNVDVITTDELFAGITYQPLNLGCSTGKLAFHTTEEVDGVPIDFREIAVIDAIPNDIGIVAGVITDAFQTPLSHINVLAQNRGTPNMALIGAWDDPTLRSFEGKWVEFCVNAFDWTVEEITFEEAEAWWEENKPEPLTLNPPDLTVQELIDAEDIWDMTLSKTDAIAKALPSFGGKVTHFAGLVHIGPDVPTPDAFGVPIHFYWQFMEENGFRARLETWLDPANPNYDPQFKQDALYRQEKLEELQADMLLAPLDPVFEDLIMTKLKTEYPGVRMRFRSSTNAEDLGEFTGAGLYSSNAGTPDDPDEPADVALKTTWGSVWNARAYDEREYYSIDQLNVGMALLVHPSFPTEEANGVAITNNIFDPSGLEPGFYINTQVDGWSVVLPEIGITSDQILYYYDRAGQPIVYLGHSSIIPEDYTVLDTQQVYELGTALKAIHDYFYEVYGDRPFYAMDTEFKFDDDGSPDGTRKLYMKQARPYPGRGE